MDKLVVSTQLLVNKMVLNSFSAILYEEAKHWTVLQIEIEIKHHWGITVGKVTQLLFAFDDKQIPLSFQSSAFSETKVTDSLNLI